MSKMSPSIERYDRLQYLIFVLFLVINLFFPAWSTDYGLYFCSFILANAAAAGFIIAAGFLRPTRSPHRRSITALIVLILLYLLVNMFVSIRYNPWYWDLANKTISFTFLLTFIYKCDHTFLHRYYLIETILIVAAISSLFGIIFYLAGYDTMDLRDFKITLIRLGEYAYYSDTRLTWIYLHKSTHSMMLLLFTALGLRYFNNFTHKAIPILCLLTFAIAMYLSNTMAAIAGIVMIYVGFFMYRLLQLPNKYIKISLFVSLVSIGVIAAILLYFWVSSNRSISTLGSRLPIWKASVQAIRDNPMGVGSDFTKIILWGEANNCHNSFMNEMFRFSIPVGGLYICIFLFMMYATMCKRNFFTLATWGAFMISINMDYTLQAQTLSFVLILLYLIFFYEPETVPS